MGPLPAEEGGALDNLIIYQNLGQDDIPEAVFEVVWYMDGRFCMSTGLLVPLRSQESDRFHGASFELTPGTHTYRFVLDSKNHVQETDETNNVIEGSFTVLPKGHPDVGKDVPADSLNKQLATRPGLFNR
jgi:subtilase family serine protease